MIRSLGLFFIRSLPLVLAIVILVEFVVTNHLAGLGNDVGALDRKIATFRDQNEALAQEVASASSLLTIAEKAKAFGYIESAQYLTAGPEQFPVALRENH